MRTENNRLYYADEGKTLIRKSDWFDMGDGLDLGENDSIDNYEEADKPQTEEE